MPAYDTPIKVQVRKSSTNALGDPIHIWEDVFETWAIVRDGGSDVSYSESGALIITGKRRTFRVRQSVVLNGLLDTFTNLRIVQGGIAWSFLGSDTDEGRRADVDLECVVAAR
ncbi:MAG: hypothetical protein OXR67_08475 [Chloroflexota bacterium]|nr:hypothetical protein [Chloroflexota bacterium]